MAYVTYTQSQPNSLEEIPIVKYFPDIFPKELPVLPLDREVEFTIDIAPGTEPFSKAPY